MSFCRSSDCHTVVFHYVMTLFRRLAPPYLSQLYCHHSLRHMSHASSRFTASSHSLSLSVPFRAPPLPDCTDCYDRSPFVSIPFYAYSIPTLTNSIPWRRRLPRLSCVLTSVRGRWASAERRPSSLDALIHRTSRPPTMVPRPAPKGFHA